MPANRLGLFTVALQYAHAAVLCSGTCSHKLLLVPRTFTIRDAGQYFMATDDSMVRTI